MLSHCWDSACDVPSDLALVGTSTHSHVASDKSFSRVVDCWSFRIGCGDSSILHRHCRVGVSSSTTWRSEVDGLRSASVVAGSDGFIQSKSNEVVAGPVVTIGVSQSKVARGADGESDTLVVGGSAFSLRDDLDVITSDLPSNFALVSSATNADNLRGICSSGRS